MIAAFRVGNLDKIWSVTSSNTVSLGAFLSPGSSGVGSSSSISSNKL